MAKEEEQILTAKARIEEFNKRLMQAQKELFVEVYCVNQAFENGEVHPIIKIKDNFKLEVPSTKTYEDKPKARDIANKKA